jgi:hypothetical protein
MHVGQHFGESGAQAGALVVGRNHDAVFQKKFSVLSSRLDRRMAESWISRANCLVIVRCGFGISEIRRGFGSEN